MSDTPNLDSLRARVQGQRLSDLNSNQRLLNRILWMVDNAEYGIHEVADKLIGDVEDLIRMNAENRVAGREEALQILLEVNPDHFSESNEYIGDHPVADTGDYTHQWKTYELRKLFHLEKPGSTSSLIDRLQGIYWHQIQHIQEVTVDRDAADEAAELNLCLAIRISRDLGHAIDELPVGELRASHRERHRQFKELLTGRREYRHQLHALLSKAESERDELREDGRLLTQLEDFIKACPHASITYNDDPDLEDDLGMVPVGFSIRIRSCKNMDAAALSLREVIDIADNQLRTRLPFPPPKMSAEARRIVYRADLFHRLLRARAPDFIVERTRRALGRAVAEYPCSPEAKAAADNSPAEID